MGQDTKNISRIHHFMRYSKSMFVLRKIYSVGVGAARYGVLYEAKWIMEKIKQRIAVKRYYKKIFLSDEQREEQKKKTYEKKICFSILVPLYNTPENFLREMMESVLGQTYSDWQLCLADGSDQEHSYVGSVVKEYSERDSRIDYQILGRNGGISENTNVCMQMAKGEFIVLFDHDDILHEAALFELRKAIDDGGADFIYTDEAVFSKSYQRPDHYHLKPDFAIDDLRSNNYICHITCFSKDLLREKEGFRKEYDGSQDFDLVLRLTERAKHVVHIPKVLYFWRCHASSVASDISAKTYCIDAGRKAVESHLERVKVSATVQSSEVFPVIYRLQYKIQGNPLVSIIVKEDQQGNNTQECIKGIRQYTGYSNYEILTCRNEKERNGIAVSANGEYLVFVDGECQVEQQEWLPELLGVAQRKEIGVVGPKIVYKNDTIRDVGMILGLGSGQLAANSLFRLSDNQPGYMGNMYYIHNVSAVSDSCLMVRKEYFLQVGGFDADLPSWYAGIDLSLKLKKAGRINAVNPYARLCYLYKEDRRDMLGGYQTDEKYHRILIGRWKEELDKGDPFYNPNLTKKTNDYAIG